VEDILIRNGRVIDPAGGVDSCRDVLISEGRIEAIVQRVHAACSTREIDASGLWVCPGLIDLHVHLREPGFEYKETIYDGARAAARGGFTSICCMPNTNPATDSPEAIAFILKKAAAAGFAKVLPIAAVTKGQSGFELTDMDALAKAGACAFSEDGKSVADSLLIKKAFRKSAELRLPMLSHCEDPSLADNGVINEGAAAQRLNLPGISSDSEDVIIARDLILARSAGAWAHICHMSTKGAVKLLEIAKKQGIRASGEATPHHFSLCDDDIHSDDGNYKMNPPLRTREDMMAIRQGLKYGTIDAIATDHAPHAEDEKNKGFAASPFGIAGLETALGLSISVLVEGGWLEPFQLIEKLSANPAKILGIDAGALKLGLAADIAVINPQKKFTVAPERFLSKGKNSPFCGRRLSGVVEYTIIDGRVVWRSGY
jgi:dihydroorotase